MDAEAKAVLVKPMRKKQTKQTRQQNLNSELLLGDLVVYIALRTNLTPAAFVLGLWLNYAPTL